MLAYSSPDLAEAMFLIATILFVIGVILVAARPEIVRYFHLTVAAGLACAAFGVFAL